ncbi:unnamed protein product [Meloidogyne enterolobii]|uniref:Uncharacterized protein n=1 Tax=Meloidogyne enterolobii TaxID=390850 RepID=A0ACB1A7F8_MELEN
MNLYLNILIILLFIPLKVFCKNNDKIQKENKNLVSVQTLTGKIIGKVEKIEIESGQIMNVDIFFGIPYAEPPVGNLRFEVFFEVLNEGGDYIWKF